MHRVAGARAPGQARRGARRPKAAARGCARGECCCCCCCHCPTQLRPLASSSATRLRKYTLCTHAAFAALPARAQVAGTAATPCHGVLHEPLIVEPRFKEQFLIANPTPHYERLLQVRVPPCARAPWALQRGGGESTRLLCARAGVCVRAWSLPLLPPLPGQHEPCLTPPAGATPRPAPPSTIANALNSLCNGKLLALQAVPFSFVGSFDALSAAVCILAQEVRCCVSVAISSACVVTSKPFGH